MSPQWLSSAPSGQSCLWSHTRPNGLQLESGQPGSRCDSGSHCVSPHCRQVARRSAQWNRSPQHVVDTKSSQSCGHSSTNSEPPSVRRRPLLARGQSCASAPAGAGPGQTRSGQRGQRSGQARSGVRGVRGQVRRGQGSEVRSEGSEVRSGEVRSQRGQRSGQRG